MEPATVSEAQHQTKQYCCQLKILYTICCTFLSCFMPPSSPDFIRFHKIMYNALKLVVGLMAFILVIISPKVMIMMCVVCRLIFWNKRHRVYMTDWPIGSQHMSHRTQQTKRKESTHPAQASTYKELCKGRATELYKLLLKHNDGKEQRKNIFHTFKHIFIFIISFTKIFDFIVRCFTVTLTTNNAMLPLSSF